MKTEHLVFYNNFCKIFYIFSKQLYISLKMNKASIDNFTDRWVFKLSFHRYPLQMHEKIVLVRRHA